MTTKETILTAIEEQHIQFIELWFTDILGVVKNVVVPAHKFERVVERGTHFDGSSVDGFARVAESDMILHPDLSTFAVFPWTDNDNDRTARLICNVYTPQGEPFIGDPRAALIKVLDDAKEMGFSFKTGIEMEFFLFQRDENGQPIIGSPYDEASYFEMTTDRANGLRRYMLRTLEQMNIPVYSTHSEIGHGQHEIDFQYSDALETADRIMTARVVLKLIAQQHNLHCTFMPRPSENMPGSGLHTHQSLHYLDSGENAFADNNHEYGLSDVAQQFLAGQLQHAQAMAAVIAPLVNSYKRLGTSFEAPVTVSWAHINRAALIRVPSIRPGMEAHTRLEFRAPDPSANPYLATAAMLKAGLDGIQNKMTLPNPLEETLLMQKRSRMRQVEVLPATLGDALDALDQDEVILNALGPYIGDRFVTAKRQEFEDYNRFVSSWEIDRYINKY